jgi:beta-glucosidase-like glycosyl hydrolase
MTKSFVQALQAPTKDGLLKVGATCKHLAGYSLEQWSGISRFEFDAIINARDLQETYLPAFEACVDAKVSSIMCSYNLINGSAKMQCRIVAVVVIICRCSFMRKY